MELKITTEKVLDAAAKCPTAKATLKVLFPDAFKKEVAEITWFTVSRNTYDNPYIYIGSHHAPDDYEGKCLVLSDCFDWQIQEYNGRTILIPKAK